MRNFVNCLLLRLLHETTTWLGGLAPGCPRVSPGSYRQIKTSGCRDGDLAVIATGCFSGKMVMVIPYWPAGNRLDRS